MIGFVTWPPLLYHHYYKDDHACDKANYSCENTLQVNYSISYKDI